MNNYIHLPASKSIGARYLVASLFAGNLSRSPRFDDCDDLKVIQQALLKILEIQKAEEFSDPTLDESPVEIDIHASGTAFRFITAVTASLPGGNYVVTGTPRLCSRPMEPLLKVLREAGAGIESLGENGTGPYRIKGAALKGGNFEIRGDVSSQFISALMLVAPTWVGGMTLRFTTPLVSRPYAEMTARVMRSFGIDVELSDHGVTVKEGLYVAPVDYRVEADWSAAGFFYEAAAFKLSPIFVDRLVSPEKSLQGDAATADLFRKMGVKSEFNEKDGYAQLWRCYDLPDELIIDMTDNPDLVPAFAVSCIFNTIRFRFTGVRNLRVKESDRLAALQTELRKFGYPVETGDDHIEWMGGVYSTDRDFIIETYDDHRIAMAFALVALRSGKIRISNPDVVEKSFADFWQQLPKVGLECHREGNVMTVIKKSALL